MPSLEGKVSETIKSRDDLYSYLGNCENGQDFVISKELVLRGTNGVGTFGGSEDHAAILG